MLAYFGSHRRPIRQTLVTPEANTSCEGCQMARGLSTFNLVKTFLEINLWKELGAIKVLENFLWCCVRVMSVKESFIRLGRFHTESYVSIWLISDDNSGHRPVLDQRQALCYLSVSVALTKRPPWNSSVRAYDANSASQAVRLNQCWAQVSSPLTFHSRHKTRKGTCQESKGIHHLQVGIQ